MKRNNDIDFVFCDDSPIEEIYVDMVKRVDVGGGGGGGGGRDGHVHKPHLIGTNFTYGVTLQILIEDEKPNELDYPSSLDDTFVGVEHGAGVHDGIRGTQNCGGVKGVAFGGLSHDPFPIVLSRWILHCAGRYSFGISTPAFASQKGPLFVGQIFEDKQKLKIELGLYAIRD
ncbi:hypothetical protein Q3G72_020520 [Acer saccharum]|nr:hypothetical protein Q3G72_020520 [Acer saccharum]